MQAQKELFNIMFEFNQRDHLYLSQYPYMSVYSRYFNVSQYIYHCINSLSYLVFLYYPYNITEDKGVGPAFPPNFKGAHRLSIFFLALLNL